MGQNGFRFTYTLSTLQLIVCPSGCPRGEKETSFTPPAPGVCCPTRTCERIVCTLDGEDYVEGEMIPSNASNPCEYNW